MFEWAIECTVVVGLLSVAALAAGRFLRAHPAACHALWLLALLKLVTPSISTGDWPPLQLREMISHTAATTGAALFEGAETSRNQAQVILRKMTLPGDNREEEVARETTMELYSRPSEISEEDESRAGRNAAPWIPSGGEQSEAEGPDAGSGKLMVPNPSPEVRADLQPQPDGDRGAMSRMDDALVGVPVIALKPRGAAEAGWAGDWFIAALLAVWLLGAAVCLAVQLRRAWLLLRIASSSSSSAGEAAQRELVERVRRIAEAFGISPPRVAVADVSGGPCIFSCGRTTLIWPLHLARARKTDGAAEGDDAIIAHELAHVKRRDHWVGWIELIAACVWWWHPLQWLVRRQLRHHAELAADAWAVSLRPGSRRAYAEALIEVSSMHQRAGLAAPALGVASSTSRKAFERRLSMIMNSRFSGRLSPAMLIAAAAIGLLVLPRWTVGMGAAPAGVSVSQGELRAEVQRAIKLHHARAAMHRAVEAEDWPAVVEHATAVTNLDKTDGEAFRWLGFSLIATNQDEAAREALHNQAMLGHQVEKAAYNAACTYARQGDADKAFEYLNKALASGFDQAAFLEEDPDLASIREDARLAGVKEQIETAAALQEKSAALWSQGRFAEALPAFEELAQIRSWVQPVFHRLGYCRIITGDIEGAREAFAHELEIDPDNNVAFYNLACCASRSGATDEAIGHFAKAVERGFANIELIENDIDLDSIREHRRFEEIADDARSRVATLDQARNAFDDQQWSAAAESWAAVIEMQPDDGEAYYHLGFALHHLGKCESAIDAFAREAELGHALPRSLYNMACGYAMLNDSESALAHLEASVDAGFDDVALMMRDSDLDSIRASKRFDAVMRKAGDIGVLENFGAADWAEAYAKFQQAVEADPENGRAWNGLGFAALRLDKHEEARKAFTRQKEVGFAEANAMYNIACVEAHLGNTDAALDALAESLELGFDRLDHARTDPDLASLRSSARFEQILASAKITPTEAKDTHGEDKEGAGGSDASAEGRNPE